MKLEQLRKIREQASENRGRAGGAVRLEIKVSMGTSGIAAGSRSVLQAFLDEIDTRNLTDVSVTQTGERGWASCEPVAEVQELGKEPVFYSCLTVDKVRRIAQEHIVGGTPVADYQINPAG
ncbi:(2Fe-2S) ferredoxin domain-containing protein [Candidatus Bipolaricaulota bacterium]|nr:(2Fe-2S) ferredoxin domain-containing protein [Candidatus Bipolaricaulota bacterium]TFH11470.1 MAG: (2Fe-2S) ferredoxin domain-containing protein [Candidatus Atribacteria bacterium]